MGKMAFLKLMGKKGRDKKALQEVACCCSLAGDFYLVIGLAYEVLPN